MPESGPEGSPDAAPAVLGATPPQAIPRSCRLQVVEVGRSSIASKTGEIFFSQRPVLLVAGHIAANFRVRFTSGLFRRAPFSLRGGQSGVGWESSLKLSESRAASATRSIRPPLSAPHRVNGLPPQAGTGTRTGLLINVLMRSPKGTSTKRWTTTPRMIEPTTERVNASPTSAIPSFKTMMPTIGT